jgi:hypothetical protein
MSSAKIKDSLQKLSFLKSYSSLIIPIIIVVVAGLLFIPTYSMSDKLKAQVNKQSIASSRNASSLIANVPSSEQWKQQQIYQQAYEQDAERISFLPKESSQRELLSYNIFPKPQGTSWAIFQEFGRNFRQSIENMVTALNARDCPTQAEITRSTGNRRQIDSQVDSQIKDAICLDRAKSISIYANPADFSGYTFWENYVYPDTEKAVTDCWYWQLAYWIIEDVFSTAEAMNFASNSVFTSPLKRIMTVNFNPSQNLFTGISRTSTKSDSTPPKYISSLTDEFTPSFTERLSNEELDVVHFNISVIISAKAVPRFMQELCSAKLHTFRGFSGADEKRSFKHNIITILETQINPVDLTSQQHELYRYGEGAIVKLDLICEYIFIKAGYDPIKPDVVKNKTKSDTATLLQ